MGKDFTQLEWDDALADDCRQLVRLAVREDLDRGHDWTTVSLVDREVTGGADVVVREPGVVAGLPAARLVLDEMQADVRWQAAAEDGEAVVAGQAVATLAGSARDMLTCERIVLNLLGRLSGIATLTRQFLGEAEGTAARIYDTRKTTPGWRRLEKYAVRCGGGCNHRTGLFDGVLIKDNHLAVKQGDQIGPSDAIQRAREFLASGSFPQATEGMIVEIEVDSLAQLELVLPAAPDIVLLDNMSLAELRQAVDLRNRVAPAVELEVSGGVTLERVREISQTGVERISAGALTHSARTLDVGLDWKSAT